MTAVWRLPYCRRRYRKMEKAKIFVKAVYAGVMIGVGGIVYLSVENKIAGSFLFSFGLLTIVTQGFYLYTGKIGFVTCVQEIPDMLVTIAGNYAGTMLAALLAAAAGLETNSMRLVLGKLEKNLLHVFFLSVFCGILMYLAIDNYNRSKQIVFVILPVMIFILSGFEHSVANMFYFHLAGVYSMKSVRCLLVMLAGNGVGAKLFSLKSKL